ncbi:MAG: LptE family protein [Flavobacteriales bacterium]
MNSFDLKYTLTWKKFCFLLILPFVVLASGGCGFYNLSFTGGQYSGARTFSVDYFRPQAALSTPIYAQRLTESMKDLLVAQSPLKLVETDGELQYAGAITEYKVTPVAVEGGASETASLNRLTISVKINYVNTIETDLSFERSFSKFADFDAGSDLFSVEENLWKEINEQLTIEIFNASVGNW